jgi:small-conductance mechanosensitive channel
LGLFFWENFNAGYGQCVPEELKMSEEKEVSQEKELSADVLYGTQKSEEAEPEVIKAEDEADKPKKETSEKEVKSYSEMKRSQKKKFVFDEQKYRDQGVTDDATLDLLKEKDKELHNRLVTIGVQGTEKKDQESKLKDIQKQLVDLKGKAKELSDDEYDELAMESPSQARKRQEEAKQAQEEETRLMREQVMIQNQNIIDSTATDEYEALNIDDIIPDVQNIIMQDITKLGGSEDQIKTLTSNFKKDPLGSLESGIFHNIVERVQLQYRLNDIETEKAQMEATIKQLRDDLKSKPQETVQRIKKVSNSAHTIDSVPSGYSSQDTGSKKAGAALLYG